jgi:hypothetical protein
MRDVRERSRQFLFMIRRHFPKEVVKNLVFLEASHIKEVEDPHQAYQALRREEIKARFRARREWIRHRRAKSGFASPAHGCAATVLSCGLDAFSPELNRCRCCCMPVDMPICCVCARTPDVQGSVLFDTELHLSARETSPAYYHHPDRLEPYGHGSTCNCTMEPTLVCVGEHARPKRYRRTDCEDVCPAVDWACYGLVLLLSAPYTLPCWVPVWLCRGWSWWSERVHSCLREESGADPEARHALDWGGATTCCWECAYQPVWERYPVRSWRDRTYALTDRGEDGAPLPNSGAFEY